MSVSGIRKELERALKTISGLRVFDTAPDSIKQLPAAYILPLTGDYHHALGGGMVHTFEVVLLVSRAPGLEKAQEVLDEYLSESGSKSIIAALEDADLGDHGDTVEVKGYHSYGGLEYGDTLFIGCKFAVEVVV